MSKHKTQAAENNRKTHRDVFVEQERIRLDKMVENGYGISEG